MAFHYTLNSTHSTEVMWKNWNAYTLLVKNVTGTANQFNSFLNRVQL